VSIAAHPLKVRGRSASGSLPRDIDGDMWRLMAGRLINSHSKAAAMRREAESLEQASQDSEDVMAVE